MAEKTRKTQAEKAAKSVRPSSAKTSDSIASKKAKTSSANAKVERAKKSAAAQDESAISPRFIFALTSLILFIFSLVAAFTPEGALVKAFNSLIHGLLGNVGFLVSIPALLYAFLILAFSGRRPVVMRCVSLLIFVLLCGSIYHLVVNSGMMATGFAVVSNLYLGGTIGTTGGVICGGIAMLLCWLCGTVISYIVLFVAAAIALLASMQITVPSIIRAIRNRPRAEWEEEDALFEDQPEPAAVVVNHLATKRIAHMEQKRRREADRSEILISTQPTADSPVPVHPKENSKAQDLFRQIDIDIESPVGAAGAVASQSAAVEESVSLPAIPVASESAGKEVIEQELPAPQSSVPAAPVPDPEPLPKQMPPLQTGDTVAHTAQVVNITKKERVTAKDTEKSAAIVAMEVAKNAAMEKPQYCFPPLALLKKPTGTAADGTAEMRENTRRLNETLQSFKIEAHIINVTRGPSVTRYEVELEKGVRLNKLTAVADDIALSLGASGVRIAAVPGKISVVGIEVPNRTVTTVSLQEVIGSKEFARAKSKSSFAIGKDIGGTCIVGNIAKLPHMLIAGTTGSGKSVCMNSIIISLLYKASPDDVKLIMVDPKMVELGIYNGIPHLLIPVVTDPKKAAGSLQWAVTEMMRRYRSMSDMGVRDLESYNSIVETQEDGQKLPQIVVIIDELADLMLVAAKEVEESICRIAQMGRAAGIHLIIATQRPSADVITGLMKANIPSRIAFAVASAMESRIILDTMGAEKLVGKGDMLYAPIGSGKPLRVQGCFVSDQEVESVATYVKENFISAYDQSVIEEIERKAAQTGTNGKAAAAESESASEETDGDEMLPAAVDVILETGQASVSMLQRRLKLGYARAARIVDEMEDRGIVGPFQGSKPRDILITKEQWNAMSAPQAEQMHIVGIDDDDDSFSSDSLI